MKTEKTVEVYIEDSNFAVIKIPSRKYPGVLIQGDSLLDLLGTAREVIELFEKDQEEAKDGLIYLYDELKWRFENYQKVLNENGTPFLASLQG